MSLINTDKNGRRFAWTVAFLLVCVAALPAQDLSGYRKFAFGADLSSVAKEAGLKVTQATTICQRPALIQLLEWQPNSGGAVWSERNSAKMIAFRFLDGALFRVSVIYDRASTEGLTAADMTQAISVNYGTATKVSEEMIFPSIYQEKVKVLARWEDSQYSFSLLQSPYPMTFGLVGVSKRLDALAIAATEQAKALDAKEAPQKEMVRREREEAEAQAALEKIRLANKSGFKP